jgi:hypothetical protein
MLPLKPAGKLRVPSLLMAFARGNSADLVEPVVAWSEALTPETTAAAVTGYIPESAARLRTTATTA